MTEILANLFITIGDEEFVINVTYYNEVKGSYSRDAASDGDFYGYTDMEYFLTDSEDNEVSVPAGSIADIEEKINCYFH